MMKKSIRLHIYLNVSRFGGGEIEISTAAFDAQSCATLEYMKIGERVVELDVDTPKVDYAIVRQELKDAAKAEKLSKLQNEIAEIKGAA